MSGYRQSRFAVDLPVKRRKDEFIAVYNTMTEALILMTESQWTNIVNADPAADPETVEPLIQLGILVRDGLDETMVFKEWKQRHVHDFNTMRSKVLVTRRCNNECTYCILNPEAKDMSAGTARKMDDYYLDQIAGRDCRIECQYDAGSRDFERIPEMLDDMNLRHIELEDIAFTPILAKRGESGFCAGMGDVENFLFLKQAAAERGVPVSENAPSNTCLADFRCIYVFDTDGSIIPCPSLQGGEMAYSNVFNGIDCHYDTYRSLLEYYIRAKTAEALSRDGFLGNGQAS